MKDVTEKVIPPLFLSRNRSAVYRAFQSHLRRVPLTKGSTTLFDSFTKINKHLSSKHTKQIRIHHHSQQQQQQQQQYYYNGLLNSTKS
jgi:hypothetical protein